jgi:AcrR family transcriptional regulator
MSRPPPPPALTDTAIAVAALAVLDRDGYQELSLRKVAAELGTSHTTVHRHCGTFDGLLDLCADHLAAELPLVEPTAPWIAAARTRFTALFESLIAHPGLVVLRRGRPWLGEQMMRRFSEPAMAASLAAGMSAAEMAEAHRELYMFTTGCALTYASYDTRSGRTALAVLDPAEFPTISAHLHELADDAPIRRSFELGLDRLLASLDPSRTEPTTDGG